MIGSDPAPALVTRVFQHPDAQFLTEDVAAGLRIEERLEPPDGCEHFYLWAVDDHLELRHGLRRGSAWVTLDELSRRAGQGGHLLRACGTGACAPRVLDVMAGWGVDALVLASRGRRVCTVERQAALVALQRDLIRRAGVTGVECRMGDGYRALEQLAGRDARGFDVVYLDPMFPLRRKGALPGKRMQWLAELAEPDSRPLSRWLEAARACAGDRVVLKRRRKDPVVGRPDWQIAGRTVRYDVYRSC